MVKFGLMVLCILASSVSWTNGGGFLDDIGDKASSYVNRAAAGVECRLGSKDACMKSFFLEHKTEILVSVGALIALLVACFICCRCCSSTKPGIVYLQKPVAQNYQRV